MVFHADTGLPWIFTGILQYCTSKEVVGFFREPSRWWKKWWELSSRTFEMVKEGVGFFFKNLREGERRGGNFFQSTPDSDLDSRQKFPPLRTTDREQNSSGKREKRKLSSMQWTRPKFVKNVDRHGYFWECEQQGRTTIRIDIYVAYYVTWKSCSACSCACNDKLRP